jgi:uncharacterized membrane protein YdfJ with MMPL/SSD domain
LWLLFVVLCSGAGALVGTNSLTNVQSEVGQSAQADRLLQRVGLVDPAVENVLVSSSSAGRTAQAAAAVRRRLVALSQVASVQGPRQSSTLSSAGRKVVLVQVTLAGDPEKASDDVAPVEQAVAAAQASFPRVHLQEAGDGSFAKSVNDSVSSGLSRAEKIALPITLIVLVLAFGALFAASIPLLLGLTSVAAASGALGLVSHLAPNSDSTSAVVILIGLAVGVDYSLFYLRREREERRRGRPQGRLNRRGRGEPTAQVTRSESALEAAASSVGRAILVSGLTVIIALAGLLITGIGDFVSIGLGTILVVAIAMLGSLTVLPAVLALMGDRTDRGRIPGDRRRQARRLRRAGHGGVRGGFWAGLARAVTARPIVSLLLGAAALGALSVPLFGMRTAALGIDGLPHNLPVVTATQAIEHAFPGAPADVELVVRGAGLGSQTAHDELTNLGLRAEQVTGGRGPVTVAVSQDQSVARVNVPMPQLGTAAANATVDHLREQVAPRAEQITGARDAALITGDAAANLDYANRLRTATVEVIVFVLTLGFLLLLFTFRAPILAAAVMLLNLLSIGASYGILVLVFQGTWAEHLLAFRSTGHIIDWLPLFMFVVLFGLSMDYTVLVLERIGEARHAGRSPRQSAIEAIDATGGTVTSAAVVMVAVFSIFATLDVIAFKELGVGLAAAILLDATLVRGLMLPATVTLLGTRAWPLAPRVNRHRTSRPRETTADPTRGAQLSGRDL